MDARPDLADAKGAPTRAVVRSARAADRLGRALCWLEKLSRTRPAVVVAPTVDAAAELVRAAAPRGGAILGWHRLTLARLAGSLAAPALAHTGRTVASPLTLVAMTARIVHRLGAERLGRFGRAVDLPGLPLALSRTLAEVREARLGPKDLLDEDLAAVLGAYEEELAQAGLSDRADVLRAAVRAAQDDAHPLVGPPLLLLDVPVSTELEAELIGAIASRASSVLATVPLGDERTSACFATAVAEPEEVPRRGGSSLARMQQDLFSASSEQAGPTDDVVIFSAPGESCECVEIARAVHREAARGVAFDRMAVVLRSPEPYRAHLEDALRRAEIPAYFAGGTRVVDPAGRAMLALLACAAEDLSASRFAEYLSLGEAAQPDGAGESARSIVPSDPELAFPIVAADSLATQRPAITDETARQWERVLVDSAVISGMDRWARRVKDPELSRFALPLLSELEPLGALHATWRDWRGRLSLLAARALRAPDAVLAALRELALMDDIGPIDLAEVRLVLTPRLADRTLRPTGGRFGKLFVGAADDVRGLSFDVVFVPGMAERIFPRKVTEDPILPDRRRAAHAKRLVTNVDRSHAERLALRVAIGAASVRAVISYPRLDTEQSRPRTPSFYALELLRASEGKLPGCSELSRRAENAFGTRLGWPAPAACADAIDAAEHDLSLLESILDRNEKETVGTARYLLGANPHLARALRFRARRWLTSWTRADGLVDPDGEAKQALAAHALSRRSFSPTALQHFAACPYRFVLAAIHKLSPREEPKRIEELDPLTRGSLIHEVQYELLSELRDEGLLPVTREQEAAALSRLDRVLDRVALRFEEELAPAIDRVWRAAIEAVRGDLRAWLRRAAEQSDWIPAHFELSFGLGERRERDPKSTDEPAALDCGLLLRGSIDLVERSLRGTLRATDHKSGKQRATEGTIIGGGETLQPVLYALTLEKLFPGEPVEAGRLYYCTSAAGFVDVTIPLDGRAREAAALLARTVSSAIDQGFLPAAPAPRACEYCDYLSVCGPYEEIRTERKKKDALSALQLLRGRA